MSMKQTVARISTYSADTFGVCSALFEMGGMTVIHDPSGCNSTYTTHDEPRWFDMDSLLFISGLTEVDAIMGNDDKLVHDVVAAAKDFAPRFITILNTPIPYMTGTDMPAVAQMIEEQCGIPTYTLPTNSMHYYVHGVSKALALLAEHMVAEPGNEELPPLTPKRWCCSWKADYAAQGSMLKAEAPSVEDKPISVNIIGVTPLDFSYNGSDKSLVRAIRERGFRVLSTWAMGTTLEDIAKAGLADVNLVVSAGGLEAAQVLQRRFGIPYVVGVPMGSKLASRIAGDLKQAAKERKNIVSYRSRSQEAADTVIIGESVYSASLAMAMETEWQHVAQVFCPLETAAGLLGAQDLTVESEAQLMELLGRYGTIIADPLYKPICPDSARFVALPHEGFSGRLFRKDIPNLIGSFDAFRAAVED